MSDALSLSSQDSFAEPCFTLRLPKTRPMPDDVAGRDESATLPSPRVRFDPTPLARCRRPLSWAGRGATDELVARPVLSALRVRQSQPALLGVHHKSCCPGSLEARLSAIRSRGRCPVPAGPADHLSCGSESDHGSDASRADVVSGVDVARLDYQPDVSPARPLRIVCISSPQYVPAASSVCDRNLNRSIVSRRNRTRWQRRLRLYDLPYFAGLLTPATVEAVLGRPGVPVGAFLVHLSPVAADPDQLQLFLSVVHLGAQQDDVVQVAIQVDAYGCYFLQHHYADLDALVTDLRVRALPPLRVPLTSSLRYSDDAGL